MTLSGSKGVKNGQKMLKKATNLVKNSFFENGDGALDIFWIEITL